MNAYIKYVKKFNEVCEHYQMHKIREDEQVYDPVNKPVIMSAKLIKAAFNPELFSDDVLFSLFSILKKEMMVSQESLIRVYIEGRLSAEHIDPILYTEPHENETFESWISRATGGERFCVIVNDTERWSDYIFQAVSSIFDPLRKILGERNTFIGTCLFIGNYGYTPFGVHLDDPYSSVVHFHCGPNAKEMSLFDKDIFEKIDGIKYRFNMEKLRPYADNWIIEAGDIFILPSHHYHIGNTPQYSVGMGIVVNKETEDRLENMLINKGIAQSIAKKGIDNLIAEAEEKNISLSDWLRASRDSYFTSLYEKRGLPKADQSKLLHFDEQAAEEITKLDQLEKIITKKMADNGGDFWSVGEVLGKLSRDNIIDILNDLLEKKEITDKYELLSEDSIYIHRQKNFNLLVRFIGKTNNEKLYVNEFDTFIINPSREAIQIPYYKCKINHNDPFIQPEALTSLGVFTFEPNQLYSFKAYEDILDFGYENRNGSFLLIAHSGAKGWISWIYDRMSLQPVETICTNLSASRIQLYVRLLGAMKYHGASAVLEKLATSDYANFVRWEAVESLAQIDSAACLELLHQIACEDTDTMMRETAKNSLRLSGFDIARED
ncbi:HEAT repeat domain-containing protein [Photorhabdus luminescens]|uniref:HEAT repeat domain-containing protein n=1 Tax=Photorhabdus luminescens subsp. sonorensis TaxID=1173677 RepID=A0A5C4RET9_PHOLU|nr:HEAT repeat domain-containing protein [Photorhabdus luminescens]TNH42456.1 HEAT repeat domain-containing protein [Photorhabdus luminescens subsp. sonorensis]